MKQEKNYGCGMALGFLILAYFGSFLIMQMGNVGLGVIIAVIYCSILLIIYKELHLSRK